MGIGAAKVFRRREIRWGMLTSSTSGSLILFATVFFLTTFGGLGSVVSLSLESSSLSDFVSAVDLIEHRRRVIRFGATGTEIKRESLVIR